MTTFLLVVLASAAVLVAAGLGVRGGSRPLDERVPPYDEGGNG